MVVAWWFRLNPLNIYTFKHTYFYKSKSNYPKQNWFWRARMNAHSLAHIRLHKSGTNSMPVHIEHGRFGDGKWGMKVGLGWKRWVWVW